MEEYTKQVFEDKDRDNRLWDSIAYAMVDFRRCADEEQDFFMLIANTIIKQRDYNLLYSIDNVKEMFKDFTEEEQDYFVLMANTIIKQRDPDYDIYEDEEVKSSLGEVDIDNRLKAMEEMLKTLMNVKTAPHEQQGIEAKRHLTVDEFAKKYNIGKSQQQTLRGKGLPYRQLKENGKITYITNDVEKWLENNRV